MLLPVFNEMIIQIIEDKIAYATSDTLVKGVVMGGYWFLTDIDKNDKIENILYSTR